MGCEDFVVRLSSKHAPQAVTRLLLASPHVRRDTSAPQLGDEEHLLREDRDHIIEIEVSGPLRARVSVRFAVCQSASVDAVFSDLVADLATRLAADVVIAEDVQPDDPALGWSFAPSEVGDLRRALAQCIPKKRQQWQVDFGTTEARVTCREAIEEFVVGKGP